MRSVASLVLISSRAVYVDADGRHLNGEEPPWFPGPISEDTATLPPAADDVDPFSREGYAPSKAAAERIALDSGLPVTVIRPSKVHGRWARNPRTRRFVERMLRGDRTIMLADRGASIDHLTAAANTAALIETVSKAPGQRVLNSADPDTPTAEQIVRTIGERLDWNACSNCSTSKLTLRRVSTLGGPRIQSCSTPQRRNVSATRLRETHSNSWRRRLTGAPSSSAPVSRSPSWERLDS